MRGFGAGTRTLLWDISVHTEGTASGLRNFSPFAKIHGKLPAPKSPSSVTLRVCLLLDHREPGDVCLCPLRLAGDLGQPRERKKLFPKTVALL